LPGFQRCGHAKPDKPRFCKILLGAALSRPGSFAIGGAGDPRRRHGLSEGRRAKGNLGHTDTANSTALHVPSLGLVISGDTVYNNTHPYLAECDEKARGEWLRALDAIEALHPKAVVAGHGVLDPDSSPRHIEETRAYLRDFNQVVAKTSTAINLYEKMLALHPNRVTPGSL
jgi:hypothetical protein